MSSRGRPSYVLLEEYFDREDDRFLEQLRSIVSPQQVAAMADRWKQDRRPWARRQLLRYLDLPWDRVGHHAVVKRLLKQAEADGDDEVLGAFFVGCDRLVRRRRETRHHYDGSSGENWAEEVLVTPSNAVPHEPSRRVRNPFTGEELELARNTPQEGRLFSYHTRYYLRRRVWRYFRRMAHQRPADFPAAVAGALVRFRDEDLARGEQILDSWCLMHACFGMHDAVEFTASKTRLKDGHALSALSPAPAFGALWREPAACDVLLDVVRTARARLVRVWAVELLRREHGERLRDLTVDVIRPLLGHRDAEVQQFGAELLESMHGLERLELEAWLALLEIKSPIALETVCRLFEQHVSAARLTLSQCVDLACAEPVPVARLGLELLASKPIESTDERAEVARLAEARCEALGRNLAERGLAVVGDAAAYDRDFVLGFFDSLNREVRLGAWEWLRGASAGLGDFVLWSRLLETPYDELRLQIVDHLEERGRDAIEGDDSLSALWCAVLASVHRGGRQKLKAIRQIVRELEQEPQKADELLPVLAIALRSVRGPESREALAAIVRLAASHPNIAEQVGREIPELTLSPSGRTL